MDSCTFITLGHAVSQQQCGFIQVVTHSFTVVQGSRIPAKHEFGHNCLFVPKRGGTLSDIHACIVFACVLKGMNSYLLTIHKHRNNYFQSSSTGVPGQQSRVEGYFQGVVCTCSCYLSILCVCMPCTWQLPWLAREEPWSAVAGPFSSGWTISSPVSTNRLRNHSSHLVEALFLNLQAAFSQLERLLVGVP